MAGRGRALLASIACAAAFLCKEAFVVACVLVALVSLADRRGQRALLLMPVAATAGVFLLRRALAIPAPRLTLPLQAAGFARILARPMFGAVGQKLQELSQSVVFDPGPTDQDLQIEITDMSDVIAGMVARYRAAGLL